MDSSELRRRFCIPPTDTKYPPTVAWHQLGLRATPLDALALVFLLGFRQLTRIRDLVPVIFYDWPISGKNSAVSWGRHVLGPREFLSPRSRVFSTEMNSTWSQLNVGSGFLENDLWKVK